MSQSASPPNPSSNLRASALSLGAVVLTLLHLDFWRHQSDTLVFGWIPEELLYRLLYIFLVWAYIVWVCAWLPEAEEPDG